MPDQTDHDRSAPDGNGPIGDEIRDQAERPGGAGLRRLLSLARPHRRVLLRAFALGAGMVAANLAIPFLFGKAVGDIEARDESRILLFGTLILLAGAARAAFSAAKSLCAGRAGIDLERDIRNRLYRHMLDLDAEFHDRQRAGELVSRMMVVSGPIREFLSESVPLLFRNALNLLLTGGVLFLLEPTLALAVLSPAPLVLWLAVRYNRLGTGLLVQRQHCLAAITGEAEEILHAALPLKLLRAEEGRLERFAGRVGEWYDTADRDNAVSAPYSAAIVSLPSLGRAALFVWGGLLAIDAHLSLETFVMFVGYLGSLFAPISGLSDTLSYMQRAQASADRLFAVLDERPTVTSGPDAIEIPPTARDLALQGVCKWWGAAGEGLAELELAIAAGRNVVILGPAGSGKSALLRLLNRVYDPDAGEVQAGEARFTQIELRSLRRLVVTVGNEPHLFPTTLRENLLYGTPDAGTGRMRAVAAALGLDSVVATLPEGYDTKVGERGEPLTVAEAQLVSIAQAILAAPGILLLDDATAPLPPGLERRVLSGLRVLCGECTVIAVSNRPALLGLADEVIFLDRGRLVACGTPAELHETCPPFRALLHRWGIEPEPGGIQPGLSEPPSLGGSHP